MPHHQMIGYGTTAHAQSKTQSTKKVNQAQYKESKTGPKYIDKYGWTFGGVHP